MNTELFNLEGKTAIVTGGANGIGKGCCLMLSDAGANIVVADLKLEDAQKAVDEIKKKGGSAIAVSCNVTKDEELTNLVQRTIDEFGGIHILVNNVGGGGAGKVLIVAIKNLYIHSFLAFTNLRNTCFP